MNDGFREWREAVKVWSTRNPRFTMRRVQRGDDAQFAFLGEEESSVQGPRADDGARSGTASRCRGWAAWGRRSTGTRSCC